MCDVCLSCVYSLFPSSPYTFLTVLHFFHFFLPPPRFLSFLYWDAFDILYVMYILFLWPLFCFVVCMCVTMMHVLSSDGKSLLPYIRLRLEHVFNPYVSFISCSSFLCFSCMMSLSRCLSLLLTCFSLFVPLPASVYLSCSASLPASAIFISVPLGAGCDWTHTLSGAL